MEDSKGSSRRLALEFGELLNAKVLPNRRISLGGIHQPFRILLNDGQLKSTVYIGDAFYSLEANHRRGEKVLRADALFCVSFKNPDLIMFTRERVPVVSEVLGVDVYRQSFVDEETIEKYLLSKPVRLLLEAIDFDALAYCFLSPIQLEAGARVASVSKCVEQIRRFLKVMYSLECSRRISGSRTNAV